MTRVEPIAAEPSCEIASPTPTAVRTALLSTRRLAALFPEPALDPAGQSTSTRFDRWSARLRHGLRLSRARVLFRLRWVHPARQALVSLRLRLRLALLRWRHRRKLRPCQGVREGSSRVRPVFDDAPNGERRGASSKTGRTLRKTMTASLR